MHTNSQLGKQVSSFASQWRALTNWQRLKVAAIIGSLIVWGVLSNIERRATQTDFLRTQFHLPVTLEFTEFSANIGKAPQRPEIQGIVQFTDEQFRSYASTLNDQNLWRPTAFQFGSSPVINEYSAQALHWREKEPMPRYGGDRLPSWGNLSRERIYKIKHGSHLCFAGIKVSIASINTPPTHRIVACTQLTPSDKPIIRVLGALDSDTKTLHMSIRIY